MYRTNRQLLRQRPNNVSYDYGTRQLESSIVLVVPKSVIDPDEQWRPIYYCFGFDEEDGKDYKVARIEIIDPTDINIETISVETTLDVQLFSKKIGSWRQLEGPSGCQLLDEGVAIDGAMHWGVLRRAAACWPAKGSCFRVLSLGLRDEVLREADGPACQVDEYYDNLQLIKWKGRLGAFMISLKHNSKFQLWSKCKNDDEDCNSGWTKMFVINSPIRYWSFVGFHRDEFIISDGFKFFWYDLISQETREVDKEGRLRVWSVYDYVPSLVSPN